MSEEIIENRLKNVSSEELLDWLFEEGQQETYGTTNYMFAKQIKDEVLRRINHDRP